MTRNELYNICHDEAVAYANSEQWSKRTGEEKSFLIQGYLDAMMEARKSEITEKKKEYPKTYEVCCKVIEVPFIKNYVAGYKNGLLDSFQKLLICRDAYWKIAGDEMGLGKPWEPVKPKNNEFVYTITRINNDIVCIEDFENCEIFEFPTKEMRDAFYENFEEEMEMCKELL